jgi:magnesium-protoporphyrin O-methyltransferase
VFNIDRARAQQKEYHRKGAARTTNLLVEAILTDGVEGQTVLDIGGGVGAVQHALLAVGASRAIHVEASSAFLQVAQEEAGKRSLAERVTHLLGDFVDLAPRIPPVDIVILDRVICCYDDMQALVRLSARRARRIYGLVFPWDTWWMRAGFRLADLWLRLFGNQFQIFAHCTQEVEKILTEEGLERLYYRRSGFWQVIVYKRGVENG